MHQFIITHLCVTWSFTNVCSRWNKDKGKRVTFISVGGDWLSHLFPLHINMRPCCWHVYTIAFLETNSIQTTKIGVAFLTICLQVLHYAKKKPHGVSFAASIACRSGSNFTALSLYFKVCMHQRVRPRLKLVLDLSAI